MALAGTCNTWFDLLRELFDAKLESGDRHRESLSHVVDRISVIQPPTRVASQPRTPAIKAFSLCLVAPT